MEGHEKPCHYCGLLTNNLAGNPGLWAIPMCHRDEPGKMKWHHIQCVSRRLIENVTDEELQNELVRRNSKK
jgi:hypothetical protein